MSHAYTNFASRSLALLPFALAGLLGTAPTASAADVSWTGGAGAGNNFWDLAGNWSSSPALPFPTDNALIGAAFAAVHRSGNDSILSLQASGAFSLTGGTLNPSNASFISGLFTMSGGTLGGAGTLNAGSLHWESGTMQDTGVTTIAGAATLGVVDNVNNLFMSGGRVLNLQGASTFQASLLRLTDAAVLNNSGTFTSLGRLFSGDHFDNQLQATGTPSTFNNSGSFVQNSAAATTTVSVAFNNTGSVNAQSGSVAFTGGGTSNGSFTTAAGGVIAFGGGSHSLTGGTLSGPGTIRVSGGTTTFGTAVTHAGGGTLEISGGTLDIAGTLGGAPGPALLRMTGGTLGGAGTLNAGSLHWESGTMQDAGVTTIAGAATLGVVDNVNNLFVSGGRVLNLQGASTFQASLLRLTDAAVLNNSGTFTSLGRLFSGDHFDNQLQATGTPSTFNNSGSFVQNSAAATTTVSVAFNNTGSVNAQSGSVAFTGGGTSNGSFTTAAGGVIAFGGGSHSLTGGTLSGPGTIRVSGGTTTFGTAVTHAGGGTLEISGGTLDIAGSLGGAPGPALLRMTGGTLGGAGTLNAGSLHWESGTMQDTGVTTIAGAATLGVVDNVNNLFMSGGRVLNLQGASTFQASLLRLTDAAVLNNSGTFTSLGRLFSGDHFDNQLQATGTPSTFNNSGSFVQNSAAATTTVSVAFNNTGSVNAQSGSVAFTGGGTSNGSFTTAAGGVIAFGGGSHSLTGGTLSGPGTIRVSGGTTTFGTAVTHAGGGTLEISGGTLDIAGTLGGAPGPALLRMTGGTLGGAGTLNAGSLHWESGTMQDAGVTTIAGAATLGVVDNVNNLFVSGGRVLNLQGASTFQASLLRLTDAAVLNNSGTFTSLGRLFSGDHFDNQLQATGTPSTFNNSGSFVQNSAAATTTVSVAFNNTGELRIDSGNIVFNDSFVLASGASILDLPVAGLVNTNLNVNTTAVLDGVIRLEFGFTPTPGQVITVFTYAGHSGTFDSVVGAGLAAGFALTPIYNADSFQIGVAAVPEPETYVMLLLGLCLVVLVCRSRTSTMRAAVRE